MVSKTTLLYVAPIPCIVLIVLSSMFPCSAVHCDTFFRFLRMSSACRRVSRSGGRGRVRRGSVGEAGGECRGVVDEGVSRSGR